MTNEKTLPGTTIRFTSACTSGSSTNTYGVGSLSLQLYRPGNKYPWIDLGCIYFSAPRPEQFEAAKKANAKNPYNEGGQALSNIYRRLSKKQADYIQHLICETLTEKLKGEIPPDDEIDVIMKEAREANYPVNREKHEAEKKWELTKEQTRLLGELRAKAASKNIPFGNILLNLTIEEKVELAKVNKLVEKKWYNLSIEFNDRTSGTISLVSRSTNMVDREYEFTNEPDNTFTVNLRKISENIGSL